VIALKLSISVLVGEQSCFSSIILHQEHNRILLSSASMILPHEKYWSHRRNLLSQNMQGHFPRAPHTLFLKSGSLWPNKQLKSSKLGRSGWKWVKGFSDEADGEKRGRSRWALNHPKYH